MTSLSTHVLDTSTGRPAAGLAVSVARVHARAGEPAASAGSPWPIASAVTGDDGRVGLLAADLGAGDHRLRFETGAWFAAQGREGLWPEVVVTFTVEPGESHYHVPLLLSPFGYSTYRGS